MTKTLDDLVSGAMDLVDAQDDPSVSDDRWLSWTKDGLEDLWRLVVSLNADLFITTVDFTIANGNTYPVPADFRRLRMVERDPDTSSQRRLQRVNLANHNRQHGYTLTGNTVAISPAMNAAGNYRLTYLSGPGDAVTSPLDQYSEYVEVFAAIKFFARKEWDTSQLERRMQKLADDITEAVTMYDSGEPDGIIEVQSTGPDYPWRG